MTFKARLDDAESRAFWDAVERGSQAYEDLPSWQKGVLGGLENVTDQSDSACAAETSDSSDDESPAE